MPSSALARCLVAAGGLLAALTLPACAFLGFRAPARPGGPAALPSAADLHEALEARRTAVTSLRALARVRISDPGGTVSSRDAIVVERPDRLRVDVLSALGPAALAFTVDGGRLQVYAAGEKTLYTGAASPANLSRYAGVGLAPEQIVDLLLGTPPAAGGTDPGEAVVAADPETGWTGLRQPMEGGARVVWFDWFNGARVPVAIEDRADDGTVLWRARFDGHVAAAGPPLPTRITLEAPALGRVVDIALRDLDVNAAVEDGVFALLVPPGARVISLDERDESGE